jgi:hypothetical protein
LKTLFFALLFIVSYFFISALAFAEPITMKTTQSLSIEALSALHQCNKKFEYKIYLAGANIGYSRRNIDWQNNNGEISSTVTASGKVSIFWIGSSYQHQSQMVWSESGEHFLTTHFSQKLTGIRSREMSATMSEDGKSSTVNLNEEVSLYKNELAPLYDLDTLGAQLRLNLILGLSEFTLYRQGSDKINPYVFKVIGKETLKLKKWGKVDTLKVKEVGEYKKMVLWFSPQHDFQLIKANIDAFISPTVLLTEFSTQCAE